MHGLRHFDEHPIVNVALAPENAEEPVEEFLRFREDIDERNGERRLFRCLRQIGGERVEGAIQATLQKVDDPFVVGEEVSLGGEKAFEVNLLLERELGHIPFDFRELEYRCLKAVMSRRVSEWITQGFGKTSPEDRLRWDRIRLRPRPLRHTSMHSAYRALHYRGHEVPKDCGHARP